MVSITIPSLREYSQPALAFCPNWHSEYKMQSRLSYTGTHTESNDIGNLELTIGPAPDLFWLVPLKVNRRSRFGTWAWTYWLSICEKEEKERENSLATFLITPPENSIVISWQAKISELIEQGDGENKCVVHDQKISLVERKGGVSSMRVLSRWWDLENEQWYAHHVVTQRYINSTRLEGVNDHSELWGDLSRCEHRQPTVE